MQSLSAALMARHGVSVHGTVLSECQSGKADLEVSPIELLPDIPHGLKYPEFGKGGEKTAGAR